MWRRRRRHRHVLRQAVDRRGVVEIDLGSRGEGIDLGLEAEETAIGLSRGDQILGGRRFNRCVRIPVATGLSLGDRIPATDQIRRARIHGRLCVRRIVRAVRLRGDVRRLRVLAGDGVRMTGRGCTVTMRGIFSRSTSGCDRTLP
jgi:hypothetical protein